MEKVNKWQRIKEYINANELFTRKEMHRDINAGSTEDQYINVLRNCKFVERTAPGKYKRLLKIPISLTSSKIISFAYDYGKREKYMKLIMRKEKLENIKKRK